ncbi:hypothetical protein R1sor_011680 [Riccia sorocarpa]|uniref:Expansin n=1 Tax=Riccia sorocarpa TaxID=122646 RepID=A0ABD3I509_9MARC
MLCSLRLAPQKAQISLRWKDFGSTKCWGEIGMIVRITNVTQRRSFSGRNGTVRGTSYIPMLQEMPTAEQTEAAEDRIRMANRKSPMAAAGALETVKYFLTALLLAISKAGLSLAGDSWAIGTTTYTDAKATFYGGPDAYGTMYGACGYSNPFALGYGAQTTALSTPLFNQGLTCGACFEIRCKISASAYAKQWCYASNPSIIITATNLCPPGSYGGWCDPPKPHFDLAYAAFTRLANQAAGVIPIEYRRTFCRKSGGIKFTMNGNPYWNLVLVHNVADRGNVHWMQIKGSRTGFMGMRQNWGQNWESYSQLLGQDITFTVTLGNGRTVTFWNAVGSKWWFGQTWQSSYNF